VTGDTVEHGDAFEALANLADDSAHAAIVDYPWEFNYRNGSGRFGYEHDSDDETKEGYYGPMGDDCMFSMESEDRLSELFDELARVLVDGAWILCFADDVFQEPVRNALQASGDLIFRRNWAWEPKVMGMGYYGRVGHYPIPTATVGETDRYVQGRSTLYHVDQEASVDYPTAKPVSLYRKLLQSPVLRDGERLLEPFCGCGPGAAIASERDIRYWGVDSEERAVSLTQDRLNQQTLADFQAALTDGGMSSTDTQRGGSR